MPLQNQSTFRGWRGRGRRGKKANLVFQCLLKYEDRMVFMNDHSTSGKPAGVFADQKYLVVLIGAHYFLWHHNGEILYVFLLGTCLASGNCGLIPTIGQVFKMGVCGGGYAKPCKTV